MDIQQGNDTHLEDFLELYDYRLVESDIYDTDGDIANLSFFDTMLDCLKHIPICDTDRELDIAHIERCINLMEKHKKYFKEGFVSNEVEIALTYISIVTDILQTINYICYQEVKRYFVILESLDINKSNKINNIERYNLLLYLKGIEL